jgi:hypothetical protein
MALQSFGPWSLFQVLNPIHSRYDSMDGETARRKAATYIQRKKKNKLRGLSPQARTMPTERPPLVGEVSANFSG